jgi:hypothetical protein
LIFGNLFRFAAKHTVPIKFVDQAIFTQNPVPATSIPQLKGMAIQGLPNVENNQENRRVSQLAGQCDGKYKVWR